MLRKPPKKLNSKPAIFLDTLIKEFTEGISIKNPLAKTLLSQLSKLTIIIDSDEKAQKKASQILDTIKEKWNEN